MSDSSTIDSSTIDASQPTDGVLEPDTDPANTGCDGDPLVPAVPLSTDMAAFKSRFEANEGLLRVVMIGEPQ